MRRTILSCLLGLLLGASPAWAEPPTAEDLRPLFDALQKAASGDRRMEVGQLFDHGLTIDALRRNGFLDTMPEMVRIRVEGALTMSLPMVYATQDVIDPFVSYEIRRIRAADVPDHFSVYVRHRDDVGDVARIVWSIARQGDGFKLYDYEDLQLGMSLSSLIGAGIAGSQKGAEAFGEAVGMLMQAHEALQEGSERRAVELLQGIEPGVLPKPMEGARHLMIGAALIEAGNARAALVELAKAREQKRDMWLVDWIEALAYNELGEHKQALASAQRYVRALDGDPNVWVEIARAHVGLGEPESAVLVMQQSLAEDPTHRESIAWFAMALPPKRKGEALQRLLALPDLAEAFEAVAETVRQEEDGATLRVLAEGFSAKAAAHPDGPYYLGHALAMLADGDAKQGALDAWYRAMQLGKDHEDAYTFFTTWCDAMLGEGLALDAYAKAPSKLEAFDYLAWDLALGEDIATLRKLTARAAKDLPAETPLVLFFRAEADFLEARYERVVEALEGPAAALRAKGDGIEDELQAVMWDMEDRVMRSLLRLERFDAALALARRSFAEDEDIRYLVIVYAVSGKTDAALKALTAYLEANESPELIFEDEDAAQALRGEAFRALREMYYAAR